MQDIYNHLLRKGWTLGSELLIAPMHAVIRLYHKPAAKMLADFWRDDTPELLVSVVPNFNRVLLDAYRRVAPAGRMVTILTDLADYPPHFWIEKQEQWFICGTDRAVAQALELGHPRERVFRASGMILHPRFYEVPAIDRRAERARLGLDPDKLTGLVLFGGFGSFRMADIAEKVSEAKLDCQLIFICGKNEKLRQRLSGMRLNFPAYIEGFTSEVPYYMSLADFFVGKPGPGSISEALHLGLPVIVERNAWTLPQERYNTDWVREMDVGLVIDNFDNIAPAIRNMDIGRLRANTKKLNNRAVFEIPEMLEAILP
jgi:1,2-diacylglycerol 3-beta-galactosyltransferase